MKQQQWPLEGVARTQTRNQPSLPLIVEGWSLRGGRVQVQLSNTLVQHQNQSKTWHTVLPEPPVTRKVPLKRYSFSFPLLNRFYINGK